MKYILTITAKRKNAKRHIQERSNDINALIESAKHINHDKYIVEIYNSKWQLVETL